MATTIRNLRRDCGEMAARIDRLKRELGCTQAELAGVLGLSPETVSNYKNGRGNFAEWIVLRLAICEARLGLDPAKRDVIYPRCLKASLLHIARETVDGVERLIRRDAVRRRSL